MLTKEQQKRLQAKIEQKIKRLLSTIDDLKEDTKPISPENAIGRISRMDAINNKSVAEQSLRKAQDTLGKLQEALINIDKENFGQCQKCKEMIEFERLAFMPESRRCSKCARQMT